jgi:hypothetical protein
MTRFVVDGATCMCEQGTAPASLIGHGRCRSVSMGGAPSFAATTDNIFFHGVFGTCLMRSAQTGTPTPCVPLPVGFWMPGASGIMLEDGIALVDSDKLRCAVGGMITIRNAGQGSVEVGSAPAGPEARPWTAEDRLRSAEAREFWGGEQGAVNKELEKLDRELEVRVRELGKAVMKDIPDKAAEIVKRRAEIEDLQRLQRRLRAARAINEVRTEEEANLRRR